MCDISDDQTFPELAMSRIHHRGALFRRRDWFGQVVDEWLSVTNISDDTNATTTWTRTRPTTTTRNNAKQHETTIHRDGNRDDGGKQMTTNDDKEEDDDVRIHTKSV